LQGPPIGVSVGTLETKKVPLSAHVDADLAAEVRRLADREPLRFPVK
jgi:hypothetical protein